MRSERRRRRKRRKKREEEEGEEEEEGNGERSELFREVTSKQRIIRRKGRKIEGGDGQTE